MKKTFIAAVMLGCFALQASANPGKPKKGTPEAEITQLVIECMHAGYLTPSECADVLDEVNGYDYGIMTLSMADPTKAKKKKGGNIFEEEVPLSIDPVIDQDPVWGPESEEGGYYEDGGIPEYVIALPNGKLKMNNKYGDKIKIKKVK